jgi:hypothetical protein
VRKLFCSFCGRNSDEVKSLLAGPAVFICDGCVASCNAILGGEIPPVTQSHWDKYSDDLLLSLLPHSSKVAEDSSEFLRSHVDILRRRGLSWADIGSALSVSRQAAWERFS